MRIWRILAALVTLACAALAQVTPGFDSDKGWSTYTSFTEIRDSSLGWATEINNSARYDFNKFFAVEAGLPVYVVKPFTTATTTTPTTQPATTYASLGDTFLHLGLTLRNPLLRYAGVITATAPTGSRTHNISTGRSTFDWNNRFEASPWPVTPFAEAGFGSSLLRDVSFERPFATLGKVAHFKAGVGLPLFKGLTFEPSAYDILPIGDQKLYSRVVSRTTTSVQTVATGTRGRPQFDVNSVITGTSSLVSDHGFSGALYLSPTRRVDLGMAYTRSVGYSLDNVSVSMGVRLGHLPPQERKNK